MTARKIHLRANKLTGSNEPIAICASQFNAAGKVIGNKRTTYRYMASEIVGRTEFKDVASADRCAHCMDMGLAMRNSHRKRNGLAPLANLFADL